MATKATLEVITNEQGKKKTKRIKYSTRGPEVVEVKYRVNKGETKPVIDGKISYGPDTAPEPPKPDKTPVVELGDDIQVEEGKTVTLIATVNDFDENDIEEAFWTIPDQIKEDERTEMTVEGDEYKCKFTAPFIPEGFNVLGLAFKFTALDRLGHEATDSSVVSVVKKLGEPEPEPEPQPEPQQPGLLWKDKWGNGHERTLTGHHQFDPDDPTFETAAGQDRHWFIDGKGKCIASGARTRGYQHTPQQVGVKYVWEDKVIFNKTLDNWSKEFFQRHNEGGEGVNRYGGATFSFHRTTIEFDEEFWHNERDPKLADSQKLSTPIKDGEITKTKIIGEKIVKDGKVSFNFEIFVNDKKEWEKSFTSNHQEAAIKDALYWRSRINGTAPKDVEILGSQMSRL